MLIIYGLKKRAEGQKHEQLDKSEELNIKFPGTPQSLFITMYFQPKLYNTGRFFKNAKVLDDILFSLYLSLRASDLQNYAVFPPYFIKGGGIMGCTKYHLKLLRFI